MSGSSAAQPPTAPVDTSPAGLASPSPRSAGTTSWGSIAPLEQALRAVASAPVLERAIADGWGGRDPFDYLMEQRQVSPLQALEALSRAYGCPFAMLRRCHPEPAVLGLLTHEQARRHGALPLARVGSHLYTAFAQPGDLDARDYLSRTTGLEVRPVVVLRGELDDALRRLYLVRNTAEQAMEQISSDRTLPVSFEATLLPVDNEDAPAIRMVNYVLGHGVGLGASDVHFEPGPSEAALRCRVDGILHDLPPVPAALYRAVVSRIKVMAGLDIAEKRLPQDGRMSFESGDRSFDLRVSIIPGVHGESIVIRVLDASGARRHLHELGLGPAVQARWERMAAQPHGLVLVTGPTGSGKSTTLYTTLQHVASPRRKLVTLEDPVERQLPGISQFQIQPSIGFGFAEGLRALLRHDPDIIMVGEIRDSESAEIALRASLTGHLLFSTLHTNDALLAVTRLMDMGLPSFLVLASLTGVMAQRLLRRLCLQCRIPVSPDEERLHSLDIDAIPAGATLYEPGGCTACGGFGYRGRVAVYELFELSAAMRRLTVDHHFAERLAAAARDSGYVPMREAARELYFAGQTSFDELAALGSES